MLEMRQYMNRMYTNDVTRPPLHCAFADLTVKCLWSLRRPVTCYYFQVIERIVLQKTAQGEDALLCGIKSGSARSLQILFEQWGYVFNTSTLQRPGVTEAVQLAKEAHDKSVLMLLKSYADGEI